MSRVSLSPVNMKARVYLRKIFSEGHSVSQMHLRHYDAPRCPYLSFFCLFGLAKKDLFDGPVAALIRALAWPSTFLIFQLA